MKASLHVHFYHHQRSYLWQCCILVITRAEGFQCCSAMEKSKPNQIKSVTVTIHNNAKSGLHATDNKASQMKQSIAGHVTFVDLLTITNLYHGTTTSHWECNIFPLIITSGENWKTWVMRCWRAYLSGAKCKWLAYGPADATATPSSLLQQNPESLILLILAHMGSHRQKAVKR